MQMKLSSALSTSTPSKITLSSQERVDSAMIDKPRKTEPYPDRDLDCQMAMEEHFEALIDAAECSGWTREEAIAAVAELVKTQRMADHEIDVTNLAVLNALMRLGKLH